MNTPEPDARIVTPAMAAIGQGGRGGRRKPFVFGICGTQGSGKTTLARKIIRLCEEEGFTAATLSLDDLYLTRREREDLAATVHPLLRTRGVPGTHDMALGLRVLAAMERGEEVALPRFDKAVDDRSPQDQWPAAPAGCDVLVLEGWCLGARPQSAKELAEPVNALEHDEDPDGIWRRYANDALAADYQRLFARIDFLLLLAAPDFETVFDWRLQQETELQARSGPEAPGVMDANAIARFIRHYERLTRHILTEMPRRADLNVRLARDRSVLALEGKDGSFSNS